MFYLNAELLAIPDRDEAGNDKVWAADHRWPQQLVMTLAHEFQHMIHFYQKGVLADQPPVTWLNEMASEVAEDLVASKLGLDGPRGVVEVDSAGEPWIRRGRLPRYNYWNDIAVTEWYGELANYTIVYASGASLARTYGGARRCFANLLSDETSAPPLSRYNPGRVHTSRAGGYEFELGPINLYNNY